MNAEAVRDRQRAEWALSAPGWARYRANFTEPGQVINDELLRLAGVRPGRHVLDLACGVGNPAFEIAERVGSRGSVLGLDLSPEMVAAAAARAEECGIANARFRTIATEGDLGVPPGGFDAATCRAGLQYMPDRPAALRAVRAALRPGGRFAAMTIGAADRCVPFRLSNAVLARHLPMPATTPARDEPGPVDLSSPEELAGLLRDAGFTDVETRSFEAPIFEADDPVQAWAMFVRTAGPVMALYASLEEDRREAISDDAVRAFAAEFPEGPVRPTGEVLLAAGTRPD
ncbi:class I SAM-dependent methyltransferase [Actinomadura sp. WMMB 499]|uniref:class I SAM-dependent methyltransferase n=1 Tax=Actinomadura sp. WMMB 499 TaxID=1219491 RepID=UPI0012441107|nr:class I SAM-dependent methyltransferase [Actinomadura sp. WMMB 499]QFG22938.1 methyltransferase domain-containing protein [Actinomadura sp. WMMB 499]